MILLMYLYLYFKSIVTTHTIFMYAGLVFVLQPSNLRVVKYTFLFNMLDICQTYVYNQKWLMCQLIFSMNLYIDAVSSTYIGTYCIQNNYFFSSNAMSRRCAECTFNAVHNINIQLIGKYLYHTTQLYQYLICLHVIGHKLMKNLLSYLYLKGSYGNTNIICTKSKNFLFLLIWFH